MKSLQPEVMTCEALVELVTEYTEGAMPPAELARLEQHLYFCDGCVTYLEQMRRTSTLARRTEEPKAVHTQVKPEVAEVFRRWKASRGL